MLSLQIHNSEFPSNIISFVMTSQIHNTQTCHTSPGAIALMIQTFISDTP